MTKHEGMPKHDDKAHRWFLSFVIDSSFVLRHFDDIFPDL